MALNSRARRRTKQARRADGVTIAPAPGARKPFVWLVAAAALVLVAVVIWRGPPRRESAPLAFAEATQATARVVQHAAPAATRAAEPALHPVRHAASAPAPEEPRAAAPAAAAARAPTPSGIQLFPPPGTDPPKIGIVVPEGFELPEGYVRHYQVTDDGQPLAPILMFHPDYDWVDEQGHHSDVSADGVVPPELAPAGMPIEMLRLPGPERPPHQAATAP
jgi:hypothetical protein